MKVASTIVGLFLIVGLVAPSCVFAAPESDAEKEKLRKLPKKGTLSSSVTGGTAATTADGVWGVDSIATENAPVGGSASKISKSEWLMRVFNNSKKRSFRVQVELVQSDVNGKKLKSDHFTYTLKAGEEAKRTVNVQANTANCSLNLVDWSEAS